MIPFLLLLVAWGAAGLSCARLCLAGARRPRGAPRESRRPLTLYEAAFATINRKFFSDARKAISTLTLFAGFASTVFWPSFM